MSLRAWPRSACPRGIQLLFAAPGAAKSSSFPERVRHRPRSPAMPSRRSSRSRSNAAALVAGEPRFQSFDGVGGGAASLLAPDVEGGDHGEDPGGAEDIAREDVRDVVDPQTDAGEPDC